MPRGTRNTFYWTSWFLLSLNSLFYFIATFFVIFANRPVEKSWNVLLPGSTPFSRKDLDVVATGINLSVDVTIFMLPQRVIWSLQMAKSRKIGLSFMFSLGLLFVSLSLPEEVVYRHTDKAPTFAQVFSLRFRPTLRDC